MCNFFNLDKMLWGETEILTHCSKFIFLACLVQLLLSLPLSKPPTMILSLRIEAAGPTCLTPLTTAGSKQNAPWGLVS